MLTLDTLQQLGSYLSHVCLSSRQQRVSDYIAVAVGDRELRGDMHLELRHPRVVQKSYGSEKRCVCILSVLGISNRMSACSASSANHTSCHSLLSPPPVVILRGGGWCNESLGNICLQFKLQKADKFQEAS